MKRPTVEDDHIPFVKAGVPSLDIIDLDYPQWHTAQDTLDAVAARQPAGRSVRRWSRRCRKSKRAF